MVDHDTALRVVRQERAAFDHTKEGVYGPDKAEEAARRGLGNIVFRWLETNRGFEITDLLTGETVTRKYFPPKTGNNIYALSPNDGEKGLVCFFADGGGKATLIELVQVDKPNIWLARVERGTSTGPENIDITQTTHRPRAEMASQVVVG